jgi:hypothetical protein
MRGSPVTLCFDPNTQHCVLCPCGSCCHHIPFPSTRPSCDLRAPLLWPLHTLGPGFASPVALCFSWPSDPQGHTFVGLSSQVPSKCWGYPCFSPPSGSHSFLSGFFHYPWLGSLHLCGLLSGVLIPQSSPCWVVISPTAFFILCSSS